MTKQGEKEYLKNLGEGGVRHSINKPFSDNSCGGYLAEISAIITLLPKSPARLLDLGCGAGWTSCFFARAGYDVLGQDISKDMIDCANTNKNKEQLENLSFVVGDYEDINFDNEFDCAVFFDSLHHAMDENKALAKVYQALKFGGICIASEPGLGHENNPVAKDAVQKYNVTEKSMPPAHIIKIGKEVGFKKFAIYPHAKSLNDIIYNKSYQINKFKCFNKLSKAGFSKYFFIIFLIIFYKRYNGITILIK